MAFRLRDMANGKYMDVLPPGESSPTWSLSGHFFPDAAGLGRQLRVLLDEGTKVSPLWEVQECVVGVMDTFPATALPLPPGGDK